VTGIAALIIILVDAFVFSLLNPWREPGQGFQSDLIHAILPSAFILIVISFSWFSQGRKSRMSHHWWRVCLAAASGVLAALIVAVWFAGRFADGIVIGLAVMSAAGMVLAITGGSKAERSP
jgi:hypothetical protein